MRRKIPNVIKESIARVSAALLCTAVRPAPFPSPPVITIFCACRALHSPANKAKPTATTSTSTSTSTSSAAAAAAVHTTSTSCSIDKGDDSGSDGDQPMQDVCVLSTLDVFAKSRMLNYLNRHAPCDAADGRARPSPFAVSAVPEMSLRRAELLVPIDGLATTTTTTNTNTNTNTSTTAHGPQLRAVGFAATDKDAIVAACMHGERCLDALGVPLFTSDRLQRKRVEDARREGRYAPLPGDPVRAFDAAALPFPVLFRPDANAGGNGAAAAKPLRSYQPQYRAARRRYNDFTQRRGGDPFLRGVAGEMAYLQARIFSHGTQFPNGEEDDDDTAEALRIDPSEVEVLQPPGPQPFAAPFTSMVVPPQSLPLARVNVRPLREQRVAGFVDESEAGRFDLVEGDTGTWWVHDALPGLSCLFDPMAARRVDPLYIAHYGAEFASCVETHASEERTQVDIGFGAQCQRDVTWYTASAPLPGYADLCATGKATSVAHAVALCAMHAELMLCCLGVSIGCSAREQTQHFDACLRHGRLIAPAPRELDAELRALLPRPLKQWLRVKKTRKRGAVMSLTEKLVELNRRVVGDLRQHLVEVDICTSVRYREMLDLSMTFLRQFMVERRHPFEAAYVNFVYAEARQFRCSIYLPLPERYGVRGGCAIGATPDSARTLCALHAVDTLCALNIPVTMNEARQQQLMELRREFGLILPRGDTSESEAMCTIRSPPGYREVPGYASTSIPAHRDVWNLMMADAGDFDVVKDVEPEVCYKLGMPEVGCLLRELFQTYLLTVGWAPQEHWAHMNHYQGSQHWNGRLRLPCNNFWMVLPVDERIYGRRVALGRCIYRKSAERAFYTHVFRVLHALRLAPWDVHSDAALARLLRAAPMKRIEKERQWWEFVVRELIAPAEAEREAEMVIQPGEDLKSILSPNPVMTHELAKRTFI